MTGFIEDDLLKFEGLTDADIATINSDLPELEHLLQVIQTEWPGINKVMPALLQMALKVIAKQKELKT